MKYQPKPEAFEAVQWTGDNFDEVKAFAPSAEKVNGILQVHAFRSTQYVSVGDYILESYLGGHFNVRADEFERENEPVSATLQSQLAASQERERILMDGIRQYANRRNWTAANARSKRKDSWVPGIFGYDIAEAALKAAEEVEG